jgi:hypothetical protein
MAPNVNSATTAIAQLAAEARNRVVERGDEHGVELALGDQACLFMAVAISIAWKSMSQAAGSLTGLLCRTV